MEKIFLNSSHMVSFDGRCKEGIRSFTVLCPYPYVYAFLSAFANASHDLDGMDAASLRTFYHMACKGEPAEQIMGEGDRFLLTEESLWAWLGLWKYVDRRFSKMYRRRMVYIAIYVVRYMLSVHGESSAIPAKLREVIEGKEFATFVLDHWTGEGLTGVMTATDGSRTVIKEFRFRNVDLARIYRDYFVGGVAAIRASEFNAFAESFEESLGDYAPVIHGYQDFSERTLLQQASWYRKTYLTQPAKAQKALRHVVGFYRFLVNSAEGCRIFDDGNFSAGLLRNMSVLRYLSEGWDFVHYKSMDENESRMRLVIVLKDMERLNTRYVNGDALAFDLSRVETEFYRNLVWRYIRANRTILFGGSTVFYIAEALHLMETAHNNGRGSRNILYCKDTSLIRAEVMKKDIKDKTVTMVFGILRRFFSWTNERKFIVAESEMALDCLKFRSRSEEPAIKKAAIPRQDLDRILGRLAMEAERSYRAKLIFVMADMLAVTRFRPSQICIMNIQSIRLSEHKDFCIIDGVTKVSHGDKTTSIATMDVYRNLSAIIEESAGMRERCYDPSIRDMVFLYEGVNGFDFLREADLKLAIQIACKALELPNWTPYNVRRLYATIWDELDRELGYHGELAAQAMGHKDFDTTNRHYIDRTFEEFRRVQDADLISTDEMMMREYQTLLEGGRV